MKDIGSLEVNDTGKDLFPRDLSARRAKYSRRPRRVVSEQSRRSATLPEDVLRAGGSQLVATEGGGRNELRPSRCTRGRNVYEFPFPSRLSDYLKDNRRFRMLLCWAELMCAWKGRTPARLKSVNGRDKRVPPVSCPH